MKNFCELFPFNILLTLFRITIQHDNSGVGPGWFLDKVKIESGKGEAWYFPCGRWLAKDEDDNQISREIAAVKEDSQTYIPLTMYKVSVTTGMAFILFIQ